MRRLIAALLVTFSASLALAQSTPNFVPGQVPTAAQWNSYFAAKQDTLGYTAVRKNGDTLTGLLKSVMGAPTLSSCGTGPSVVGNNHAATVTMGTGSPTGCTITFNTANPYAAAPPCVVTWRVNLASMQYVTSQTAITLTQTATSSNKVDYVCVGVQ